MSGVTESVFFDDFPPMTGSAVYVYTLLESAVKHKMRHCISDLVFLLARKADYGIELKLTAVNSHTAPPQKSSRLSRESPMLFLFEKPLSPRSIVICICTSAPLK